MQKPSLWAKKFPEYLAQQGLISLLIAALGFCGVVVSVGSFLWLCGENTIAVNNAFNRSATERSGAIEAAFRRSVFPLIATVSFVNTSESLSSDIFARFARPLLGHNPHVKAIGLVSRVPIAERADYELHASRETTGFRIVERDLNGQMVPVADRPEYFPVRYIMPMVGNERALGYDLASQPARLAALAQSRDTGDITATSRILLVQETAAEIFSFLIFHPLYPHNAILDTVAQRRAHLSGYVSEVIRVGDLVEFTLSILEPAGIDIAVFDDSAEPGNRLMYFHSSRQRGRAVNYADALSEGAGRLRHVSTFTLANRKWLIEATPRPGAYSVSTPVSAWGLLIGGLAITVLLAGYLQILRSNAQRLILDRNSLEQRVCERTSELEALHHDLLRQERLATLGQLTGSVAHELRNPLGTILNSLELLRANISEEGRERNLTRAVRNLHRCDRIVTDMLDYARVRGPVFTPVRLNDWLREQLKELSPPQGVTFSQRLPTEDVVVEIDREQLRQALVNVLNNSFQAAAQARNANRQKIVTLTCVLNEARVCIEITDNGPGIAESDMPHIFEPLFSTKSFGVGLGLSVVKRVMEQHGGTFQIFSEPGSDTRAVMCLQRSGPGGAGGACLAGAGGIRGRSSEV